MLTAESASRLAAVSDNTLFVLGAYFFAFFPWAVTSNIDFITEKWRTVRRTRELARFQLAASVLPMIYVAVYAEAQRRSQDSKELGAALAALFFNVMHVLRTVMGMIQLDAFVTWCTEAMKCMKAMKKGIGTDGSTKNSDELVNDDISRSDVTAKDDSDDEDIDKLLKVNNTVVDNELGGTDVVVKISCSKMWDGLKKRRWNPSQWLVTEHPEVCTVRWGGAFLCGLGKDWCGERMTDRIGNRLGTETLSKFLSLIFWRYTLEQVTWDIEKDNEAEIFAVYDVVYVDDVDVDFGQSSSTAYGTDLLSYNYPRMLNSYTLEFESLRSSYPPDQENDNRENVAVGLVDCIVLAKHIGVDKLAAMRRYFDRTRIPTNKMWNIACHRLLEQSGTPVTADDSELHGMFKFLSCIPLFPFRLQMVALWDECTNWRVLQASAHYDIIVSYFTGFLALEECGEVAPDKSLFDIRPRPESIFEYCESIPKDDEYDMIGAVIETVRTFLGEWLVSGPYKPEWEPVIQLHTFEFPVTDYLLGPPKYDKRYFKERLLWECQRALQSNLARTANGHPNLPSNSSLIMLFILGLPALKIERLNELCEPYESSESGGSGSESKGSASSNKDSIVDVSVQFWRVSSVLAPQDVSILIKMYVDKRSLSLTLKVDSDGARFIWQDWIDAVMGYMKGCDNIISEDQSSKKKRINRTVRRANLHKPMLELSPLLIQPDDSDPEKVTVTNGVRIWMGWPAFDVQICKFEIDQWLAACGIDLNNIDLGDEDYGFNYEDDYEEVEEAEAANTEIERAENVIRLIVSDLYDEI